MERLLSMVIVLCTAACGARETPVELVPMRWAFEPANPNFTTATGWEVQLDEARIGIGAEYVYAPQAEKQGALALLSHAFVSVAHAQGGLDPGNGRRVMAELLEPFVADLLAPESTAAPPVQAEVGEFDAWTVELSDAAAGLDGLHGASAYVRGQAIRGDQHIRFEAAPSFGADPTLRRIELPFHDGRLDLATVLSLSFQPAVWFAQCEFERLQPAAADEVVTATDNDEVGRALAIGMRDPESLGLTVSIAL